MKFKVLMLIGAIIGIVILALFGSGLKEKAIKSITDDIPEYDCGDDRLCTSCIIKGHTCSCGRDTCKCGNVTVGKQKCELEYVTK